MFILALSCPFHRQYDCMQPPPRHGKKTCTSLRSLPYETNSGWGSVLQMPSPQPQGRRWMPVSKGQRNPGRIKNGPKCDDKLHKVCLAMLIFSDGVLAGRAGV